MVGTIEGGRKAAATNKKLYGTDFFRNIGRKGGRNSKRGGFAANPALARVAGAKGGRRSVRGKGTWLYTVKVGDEVIFTGGIRGATEITGYSGTGVITAAKRGTPLGEYTVTRVAV